LPSRAPLNSTVGGLENRLSTVRSYTQYTEWIRSALIGLPEHQVLRFCVWCLSRLSVEFGVVVWDGLIETEKETLQGILEELEAGIKEPASLPAERAAHLAMVIENFGPHDEDEALEIEMEAIQMRGAVWCTLQYIHTGNVEQACAVSEALVNIWDYHTSGNYEGYCLDRMFIFPEMRHEVELQKRYIQRLS
jgi:hypothetical protein